MINMNGKNYFNLSDYNHSIKFERVDTFHIKVTERFIKPNVPTSSTLPTQATNSNSPISSINPIVPTTTTRPTTPTDMVPNNSNEEDEPYFMNFELSQQNNESHRLIRARSTSRLQNDENVLITETVLRILKNNFLAKSKREFMYIESRNRVYWLNKRNLLVFELSNKNL